jgi:hypothetical protein
MVVPATALSAPAASAEALSTASTASAAGTIGLRFGFVDGEGTSAQFGAVESGNGFFRFIRIGHFDEGKSPGTAGVTIGHNAYFLNFSMGLEHIAQLGFGGAVGKVANIKVLHCVSSF